MDIVVAALAVLGGCDHHHGLGARFRRWGATSGALLAVLPTAVVSVVQWPNGGTLQVAGGSGGCGILCLILSAGRWKHGKLSQHQQLWEWTDRHWRVLR